MIEGLDFKEVEEFFGGSSNLATLCVSTESEMIPNKINSFSDDDKLKLDPAATAELQETLSFALRFDGREQMSHADDLMANITAKRLIRHLERSGFVLMCKPSAAAPSAAGHRHLNAD